MTRRMSAVRSHLTVGGGQARRGEAGGRWRGMRGGNESDGGRRWKERGGKREEAGGGGLGVRVLMGNGREMR